MNICMYVCMYVLYAYFTCVHTSMCICVHTCMYICNFQVGFRAVREENCPSWEGNCRWGIVRGLNVRSPQLCAERLIMLSRVIQSCAGRLLLADDSPVLCKYHSINIHLRCVASEVEIRSP